MMHAHSDQNKQRNLIVPDLLKVVDKYCVIVSTFVCTLGSSEFRIFSSD